MEYVNSNQGKRTRPRFKKKVEMHGHWRVSPSSPALKLPWYSNSDKTAKKPKKMSIPTWIQGSNTSGGIELEHLRQISKSALLGRSKSTESLLKEYISRAGAESLTAATTATKELCVLISCSPASCIESVLPQLLPLLSSRIVNEVNSEISSSSIEILTILFRRWDDLLNCRNDLNSMMIATVLPKLCAFNSSLDPQCKVHIYIYVKCIYV
jgi:hypothetical protein